MYVNVLSVIKAEACTNIESDNALQSIIFTFSPKGLAQVGASLVAPAPRKYITSTERYQPNWYVYVFRYSK